VKYFIDTEFIDCEQVIDLISLGVVAEDGREFYAISTEFDPAQANTFVRTVVIPQLEPLCLSESHSSRRCDLTTSLRRLLRRLERRSA